MEEEISTPIKAEEASTEITTEEYSNQEDDHHDEESKAQRLKQQMMVEQQHIHIQVIMVSHHCKFFEPSQKDLITEYCCCL